MPRAIQRQQKPPRNLRRPLYRDWSITLSAEPIATATVLLCHTDSLAIRSAQTDTLGAYSFNNIKRMDYLLIFRRLPFSLAALALFKLSVRAEEIMGNG